MGFDFGMMDRGPGAGTEEGEGEGPPEAATETTVTRCSNSGCDNNQGGKCKLDDITVGADGSCEKATTEEEGMGPVQGPLARRAPAPPPAPPGPGGF